MTIDVRLMQPNELRASNDTSRAALLMPPADDETWEKARASWEQGCMGASAWQGDRCVGHVGSLDLRMSLPGGNRVPTAGLTRVGVLPTHLRQGVLTRMMHEVLREEHRSGKVLAALLASEVGIYPRFGFGLATEEFNLRIDVPRVGRIAGAAPGSFRLLARSEVRATVDDVYHRVVDRPGSIGRSPWMLQRYLQDAEAGSAAEYVVVHTSVDGVDDGFAQYSVKWNEPDAVERLGTCDVKEVAGADSSVELALWQYLCRVSLVREITMERGPKDNLLRHAVADPRAVRVLGQWDELLLRPLDVDACLAGRTFNDVAGEVTVEVSDPMFPANNAVWAVSAEGARRTDAAAQVTATINAVGSTLLGGMSWVDQAVLGTAHGDAAALRRLDSLFRHHPLPYCGSFF
ncbi:MAG: GNAT family N-acetyltransferase [Actinomycetota bacterium]